MAFCRVAEPPAFSRQMGAERLSSGADELQVGVIERARHHAQHEHPTLAVQGDRSAAVLCRDCTYLCAQPERRMVPALGAPRNGSTKHLIRFFSINLSLLSKQSDAHSSLSLIRSPRGPP
jgi:hypothetical protein